LWFGVGSIFQNINIQINKNSSISYILSINNDIFLLAHGFKTWASLFK